MIKQTALTENYLKAIWNEGEWADGPVTVGAVASRLALAPSSVSEGIKKLAARGLVTHARYGAIELTQEGRRIALAIVRKHRLIETFLVDFLGYEWDEVHDEAEVLEHAVSEDFIERLAVRLGRPSRDPHGDPIPQVDGRMPAAESTPLGDVPADMVVRVVRVSDADPALLRHLREAGVILDATLRVVRHVPSAGVTEVHVAGVITQLGTPAVDAIKVVSA